MYSNAYFLYFCVYIRQNKSLATKDCNANLVAYACHEVPWDSCVMFGDLEVGAILYS